MLKDTDYNIISKYTFKIIGADESSISIIKDELLFLSKTFNVPYNTVVDDFNEYNMYVWCIEHE